MACCAFLLQSTRTRRGDGLWRRACVLRRRLLLFLDGDRVVNCPSERRALDARAPGTIDARGDAELAACVASHYAGEAVEVLAKSRCRNTESVAAALAYVSLQYRYWGFSIMPARFGARETACHCHLRRSIEGIVSDCSPGVRSRWLHPVIAGPCSLTIQSHRAVKLADAGFRTLLRVM